MTTTFSTDPLDPSAINCPLGKQLVAQVPTLKENVYLGVMSMRNRPWSL